MIREGGRPAPSLGPRTTLFAVLQAWPFLAGYFEQYHPAFWRIGRPDLSVRWTRVTTLGDVAVEMNLSWRKLARDVAAEVGGETGGEPPPVSDGRETAGREDGRLAALRDIADRLEGGGSLTELAAELRDLTTGLGAAELAGLDRALAAAEAGAAAAADRHLGVAIGPADDAVPSGTRRGHPLESLSREGGQLLVLCGSFRQELDRLGGSPSRRRWRAARPLVARLVERISGFELRVRREQQAWFPALAVLGVDGAAALLLDRQAEALECLRRLRLAVSRDDAVSTVEYGARLLELLEQLASAEQQVLVPLAERALSDADWAAVREMEDGVGWALISTPPPWPTP